MNKAEIERNFKILVDAAVAGERCPMTHPRGPLTSWALTAMVGGGMVRSEVYARNYRVVTIMVGEHKGKSTAAHPRGLQPYMINGRHVDPNRNGWR